VLWTPDLQHSPPFRNHHTLPRPSTKSVAAETLEASMLFKMTFTWCESTWVHGCA
jgi:hypothetical protein